jgi:hypothetical protein
MRSPVRRDSMGMVMRLVTLSDDNVERVVGHPPLAWLVVAPDERAAYDEARAASASRPGPLSRLLRKKPDPVPDLVLGESEGAESISIGRGTAFTTFSQRSAWAGSVPQCVLLAGGRTAGDLEISYGPVRLHTSTEVHALREYLAKVDDQEIRPRRDGKAGDLLRHLGPAARRGRSAWLPYGVMEYLAVLRDFIETAARRVMGVAISLTQGA